MAYTLLQLVAQAAGEIGLSVPTTVIGNTTPDVVQMLYLANGLGNELNRMRDWQKLTIEYRFTTTSYSYTGTTVADSTALSALSSTTGLTTNPTYFGVSGTGIAQDTNLVSVNAGAATAVISQGATAAGTGTTLTFGQLRYAFPTDFDRLVERTEWDRTDHWELIGPETPQEWQFLKSGWISTGPRMRFRQLGNLFQIWPFPANAMSLGFEYVSTYWVAVTAATSFTKTTFTVDTDFCAYPDQLMKLGLMMKYKKAKGFDVGDPKTPGTLAYDYDHQLELAKAMDASAKTLSMGPKPTPQLIGWENIPDSGYGS